MPASNRAPACRESSVALSWTQVSKVELCGKLNDARVSRGIVFAKESSEHRLAAGWPCVVGQRQTCVVVEDRRPCLAGSIGDVDGSVDAGELREIQEVEHFQAKLQRVFALAA